MSEQDVPGLAWDIVTTQPKELDAKRAVLVAAAYDATRRAAHKRDEL